MLVRQVEEGILQQLKSGQYAPGEKLPSLRELSREFGCSYVEVKDSSVDALIGRTAIDNGPLRNSRRMVLIFSTQMANNGMHLEGDRETLVNIGETRGLMQTGRVSLSAELSGRKYLCYPLNINGTRRTPIPVPVNNRRLELTLDTSGLPEGPTPFFELVAQ